MKPFLSLGLLALIVSAFGFAPTLNYSARAEGQGLIDSLKQTKTDSLPYDTPATFGKEPNDAVRYVAEHLRYPENMSNRGIQGIIHIGFTIDEEGFTTNIIVLKGVHPELNAEAVRVVKEMPRWQPALKNGKPVPCKMVMPIGFRIR